RRPILVRTGPRTCRETPLVAYRLRPDPKGSAGPCSPAPGVSPPSPPRFFLRFSHGRPATETRGFPRSCSLPESRSTAEVGAADLGGGEEFLARAVQDHGAGFEHVGTV